MTGQCRELLLLNGGDRFVKEAQGNKERAMSIPLALHMHIENSIIKWLFLFCL